MKYPPGYSELFVQRLNEINNNLGYAILSYVLIKDAEIGALVASRGPVSIDEIIALDTKAMLNYAAKDATTADRFMWFVTRGAVTVLYEAFKGDRIRYDAVEHESWFRLLASLRHSLSHGIEGEWRRLFCDANNEIRYRRLIDGREFVLTPALVGKGIDAKIFGGLPTIYELFPRAIDFAAARVP